MSHESAAKAHIPRNAKSDCRVLGFTSGGGRRRARKGFLVDRRAHDRREYSQPDRDPPREIVASLARDDLFAFAMGLLWLSTVPRWRTLPSVERHRRTVPQNRDTPK